MRWLSSDAAMAYAKTDCTRQLAVLRPCGSSRAVRSQHHAEITANPRGHRPFAMNRPAQDGPVQRRLQGAAEAPGVTLDELSGGDPVLDQCGNPGVRSLPGVQNIVFSRTLRASDYPHVTVTSDAERVVEELRATPGKDIAIFGGGELFRSLLAVGLVDRVEVSLIPVLLGGGIPLLPPPASRTMLKLRTQRVYEKTGTIGLEYDIVRSQARS